MLPYSANLVCFVLSLMTGSSFGQLVEIEFKSIPQEVQTLVTKELKLDCEVAEFACPNGTRVKDVDYIQSIQITDQDGDRVASAIVRNGTDVLFIRDKGFGDKGAEATFDVGKKSGHLYLKVPYPDESNAGNYTCTASVYKKNDAIPIIIEHDTDVTWHYTSTEELVDIVRNDVVRTVQITQGIAECDIDQDRRFNNVSVYFGRTYAKPPRVFLSHESTVPDRVHIFGGYTSNRIWAVKITKTGFQLNCFAYHGPLVTSVYWSAFPN